MARRKTDSDHVAQAPLVICKYCDSVYRHQPVRIGEAASCARCGGDLYQHRRADVDVMLALTVTSLIAFIVANCFPVAHLEMQGRGAQATLWQAIIGAVHAGVVPVAVVAAATVFFFPLLQLCLYAYVLLPLRLGWRPAGFVAAMHVLRRMQPWVMIEVFVLGVVVAIVKLGDVASVSPRIGTWGFGALTLSFTMLNSYSLRELWTRAMAVPERI